MPALIQLTTNNIESFRLTIPDLLKPRTTLASRPNGIGIIYNPTISHSRKPHSWANRTDQGCTDVALVQLRYLQDGHGLRRKLCPPESAPPPILDQKNDKAQRFKKGTRKVNLHSINYHPEYPGDEVIRHIA